MSRRSALGLMSSLILLTLLGGCGGGDDPDVTSADHASPTQPASTSPDGTDRDRPPPTGDGRGGVELEEVGSFEQPLYVTQPQAGDDALYVVEQTGRVQRVPPDGEPEVFLDLSGEVSCCGEQGLLSIAFDPDYKRSGLVYASFTNTDGDTRLVEYEVNASGAALDEASAREVFAVDQPYPNHNGGLALFGPDGHLYLGLGDGGSGGDPHRNGQDFNTPLGKLLRLDPAAGEEAAHRIPDDNPFIGQGNDAIYAYGLRNPWRFSFDQTTNDLWIGDVGQADVEEINGISADEAAGANFGWSAFEGTEPFNDDEDAPGHTPPVLTYGHDERCSVTGGYVVRDPALRSLYGRYLYGDYCQGELRSFTARPGRPANDDVSAGVEVPGLSSFGEDAAGHLYVTSIEGPVYRLVPPRR